MLTVKQILRILYIFLSGNHPMENRYTSSSIFTKQIQHSKTSLKIDIIITQEVFFGMALLSLFFMSQKQSSTPLNCIIHIRNLIKFSHLKIISNKLTTAINSLSSLGSIYFILVHARGLCYKKKNKEELVSSTKESFRASRKRPVLQSVHISRMILHFLQQDSVIYDLFAKNTHCLLL